jgi:hypothetical protein
MDCLTLLAWMEFDQLKAESQHEKEQALLLTDHISRKLAAQLTTANKENGKELEKNIKEFEEGLRPTKDSKGKKSTKQVAKSFEWPSEDQFEQLRKMQEKGGAY